MKKILLTMMLALLCLVPTYALPMRSLPATDLFNVHPCQLGDGTCPNWTEVGAASWQTDFTVPEAYADGTAVDDLVYWNVDSFNNDQYSQMTVHLNGVTSGYAGPAVRLDGSGNGYAFGCGTNSLYKFVSGTRSTLSTGYSVCADNDVVKLVVTGSTLQVFFNGVQNGTDQTDSATASGHAGMWGYASPGTLVLDWTGGNVSGGGGPTFLPSLPNLILRGCCKK